MCLFIYCMYIILYTTSCYSNDIIELGYDIISVLNSIKLSYNIVSMSVLIPMSVLSSLIPMSVLSSLIHTKRLLTDDK